MTGDPPLLFSRSWRRNFKDPHRGQKHSLGPLIITTGVPLFGRGALSRVQNCSAGVPRAEPPFTSSSRHSLFSRPPPRVCILPSSHGRSIDPQISSSPFTNSPRFDRRLSIFSCAPRHGNDRRSRHNQELRRNFSNDEIQSSTPIEPIERGITICSIDTYGHLLEQNLLCRVGV